MNPALRLGEKGFEAAAAIEFDVDAMQMGLYRLVADFQLAADLLVAHSATYEMQDLFFAGGQPVLLAIWPPLFLHCTVAEYDTVMSTLASVLPTPEMAVPLQDTVRVDPSTLHIGSEDLLA